MRLCIQPCSGRRAGERTWKRAVPGNILPGLLCMNIGWTSRSGPRRDCRTWSWILPAAVALGWMWFRLVDGLRLVWSLDPRYAYGWAVPVLCAYMVWLRWDRWREACACRADGGESERKAMNGAQPPEEAKSAEATGPGGWARAFLSPAVAAVLALAYAGVRLVQEANPWWSLVHWTLALVCVGLTLWYGAGALAMARLVGGSDRTPPWRLFVFPVAFILVAVPWPYVWGEPVIQALTRANTWAAVELLGWWGIPAVPHGNVIELATGQVGVDEACSGIRSLQGTLMLALFFGEMHLLGWRGRLAVVAAGFALALAGNLARTLLLTWVAAREGGSAIEAWHDPAGLTVLALCCAGVWLVSARLACGKGSGGVQPEWRMTRARGSSEGPGEDRTHRETLETMLPRWRMAAWAGLVWVVAVDAAVAGWYARVESGREGGPDWELVWPENEKEQVELEVSRAARELLQYDEGRQVRWRRADGKVCQMSWFRWRPGRAAGYLAKSHSPVVCMPAAGFPLEWISEVRWLVKDGVRIPYRFYRFRGDAGPVHVWYTRWEEGVAEQSFARETAGPWSRLSSVWMGRGRQGQRVLVLAVWGVTHAEEAERLLVEEELKRRLRLRRSPGETNPFSNGPVSERWAVPAVSDGYRSDD